MSVSLPSLMDQTQAVAAAFDALAPGYDELWTNSLVGRLQRRQVWRVIRWLGLVPGAAAGSWFEFYGPRVAPPFPQVGVVPWTWAEMMFLLVQQAGYE